MKIASQKSITPSSARVPKRARGHSRVAALLDAAAELFVAEGYEAVTMTAIAARAGAAVGSLYQFFPSKEALAEALLDRWGERLLGGLDDIAARAAGLPPAAIADALVGLMLSLRAERLAGVVLIDTIRDATALRAQWRAAFRARLAAIIRAAIPSLPPTRAAAMAVLVQQILKAVPALAEEDAAGDLLAEARAAMAAYLSAGGPTSPRIS